MEVLLAETPAAIQPLPGLVIRVTSCGKMSRGHGITKPTTSRVLPKATSMVTMITPTRPRCSPLSPASLNSSSLFGHGNPSPSGSNTRRKQLMMQSMINKVAQKMGSTYKAKTAQPNQLFSYFDA